MPLELLSNKAVSKKGRPPVLLLHGMWHGAWVWESRFLPSFARLGYRAYAMSLSHHAASEKRKPLNLLRINDYVEDLKEVVESLDESPVLVGHSMGGFIVQKYLEQYEAPAAVLLASVPPFGIWGGTWAVLKNFPLAFLKVGLTLNLVHIINKLSRYRYMLSSGNIPVKEDELNMERAQSESFLAYLDMLGLNLVKSHKIRTPLLVIGGGQDHAVSRRNVSATAAKYHTEAVFFEEMGHNLMLEPNADEVVQAIVNWVEERLIS